MKSFLAPVVALSLAACGAFAQSQLTINTPSNAVVCQPSLLTWSGGVPPYFLSILPGGQPSSPALFNFPSTSSTSVTYTIGFAAGTSLGLSIRDSTGATGESAPFTVQPGTDTSCVGQSSSVSFGSTAAPGASSTGQTTGAAPTTTQLTPSTSAKSAQTSAASGTSKTSTGTAASSPSSSKSAGASRVSGQVAAAGIVGAALIALLG